MNVGQFSQVEGVHLLEYQKAVQKLFENQSVSGTAQVMITVVNIKLTEVLKPEVQSAKLGAGIDSLDSHVGPLGPCYQQ